MALAGCHALLCPEKIIPVIFVSRQTRCVRQSPLPRAPALSPLLLCTPGLFDAPWVPICDDEQVGSPEQAAVHAILLQLPTAAQHRVIQRTARHRSNKRASQPDQAIKMRSMCAWATPNQSTASEQRRNPWNTAGCRSGQGFPRPPR